MEYTVKMWVDGVGRREIEGWIKAWNDQAGGRWGSLQHHADGDWRVSLECDDARKSAIRKQIDHTLRSGVGLVDYGLYPA